MDKGIVLAKLAQVVANPDDSGKTFLINYDNGDCFCKSQDDIDNDIAFQTALKKECEEIAANAKDEKLKSDKLARAKDCEIVLGILAAEKEMVAKAKIG